MKKIRPARKAAVAKRAAGRPVFTPSDMQREIVAEMVGYGTPQDIICGFVTDERGKAISEPTLRKYFKHELATGMAIANLKVTSTLFKMATSGDEPGMTAFWMKCRAGWSDKQTVELTGKDGSPLIPDGPPMPPTLVVNFPDSEGEGSGR